MNISNLTRARLMGLALAFMIISVGLGYIWVVGRRSPTSWELGGLAFVFLVLQAWLTPIALRDLLYKEISGLHWAMMKTDVRDVDRRAERLSGLPPGKLWGVLYPALISPTTEPTPDTMTSTRWYDITGAPRMLAHLPGSPLSVGSCFLAVSLWGDSQLNIQVDPHPQLDLKAVFPDQLEGFVFESRLGAYKGRLRRDFTGLDTLARLIQGPFLSPLDPQLVANQAAATERVVREALANIAPRDVAVSRYQHANFSQWSPDDAQWAALKDKAINAAFPNGLRGLFAQDGLVSPPFAARSLGSWKSPEEFVLDILMGYLKSAPVVASVRSEGIQYNITDHGVMD